ncbi:MAG: hypothetical protein LBU65_02660 [Planctomycetaceae bacterium]|jgi:hypothetical protein|nr:hypothetical protein [Planctomycetaceae bacterium]
MMRFTSVPDNQQVFDASGLASSLRLGIIMLNELTEKQQINLTGKKYASIT